MAKKVNDFIEKWCGLIFGFVIVLLLGVLIAILITRYVDNRLEELSQEYPPKMEIGLYEHIDPVTGVHYYIYDGHLYPRVCQDGSYYTDYVSEIVYTVPEENIKREEEK